MSTSASKCTQTLSLTLRQAYLWEVYHFNPQTNLLLLLKPKNVEKQTKHNGKDPKN